MNSGRTPEGNDFGVLVELGLHPQRHGGEVGRSVDDGDLALDAEGDGLGVAVVGGELVVVLADAGQELPELLPDLGSAGVLNDSSEKADEPSDGGTGLDELASDLHHEVAVLPGELLELSAVGDGHDVDSLGDGLLVHLDRFISIAGVAARHEEGVVVDPGRQVHGLDDLDADLGGVVHGVHEEGSADGGCAHSADHDVFV